MTIREIEALSGLPRANIRYYEAEGLITPRRAENGYRDYSQADADTLLRIKLLRAGTDDRAAQNARVRRSRARCRAG